MAATRDRTKECLRSLAQDFATASQKYADLDVETISRVVGAVNESSPQELDSWRDPRLVVLIRELVSLEEPKRTRAEWAQVLALQSIRHRRLSTKAQRVELDVTYRALAREPRVVAAIQAALVSDPRWNRWTRGLELLPILALEGSESSLDALIPILHAAGRADTLPADREALLERLQRLEGYAAPASPLFQGLQRAVAEALSLQGEKTRQSPAIALAESLGLGPLESFRFDCKQASTARASNGSPSVTIHARLESQLEGGLFFDVEVAFLDTIQVGEFSRFRTRTTAFGTERQAHDELGLGVCTELTGLASWLRAAAATLHMTFETTLETNVRGKKKARLAAWLGC